MSLYCGALCANCAAFVQRQLKLIDFGLSTRVNSDGTAVSDVAGKAAYRSPEVDFGITHYAIVADLWSIAICLHTMLLGGETTAWVPSSIVMA